MRIFLALVLFTFVSAATSPDSQQLRRRYGAPVMERFIARPGISVTVEYGSDGLVCEARIYPTRPMAEEGMPFNSPKAQHMSSRSISEILDEIAPPATRGKLLHVGSFQSSCGVGSGNDYENVHIARGLDGCAPNREEADTGAIVKLKERFVWRALRQELLSKSRRYAYFSTILL